MTTRVRGEYVDVKEAAQLLGVTARQVARLGELGEIHYVGRGVVERASIVEYLSERQHSRRRAWSQETAWAAVALLSGIQVDWLGQAQISRLRSRLRTLAERNPGAHELIGRARERAEVRSYESHDFLVPTVTKQLVVVDRRNLGLADSRRDQVDGYIDAHALGQLEKRYGLRRDSRGSMVLRATTFDARIIKRIVAKGNGALAALDAAGSMDARAHGVGVRALDTYLADFARGGAEIVAQ